MKSLKYLITFFCFSATLAHVIAAPELADYPKQDFLVIGTVPVSLKAKRSFVFKAPQSASFEVIQKEKYGSATEGTVLAWLDRDQIELEAKLLKVEAVYSETVELPEKQLSAYNQLRQLESRQDEIDQQLDFIEEIEANPELGRLFAKAPETFQLDKAASAKKLQEEQGVVNAFLAKLETPGTQELSMQLVEMKRQQRLLEHQKRLKESRISMPFDGIYSYLLPLELDRTVYTVLQNDPLLLVEDTSEVHGVVEIRGVDWRVLPKERLKLRLSGSRFMDNKNLGIFLRADTDTSTNKGALLYYFSYSGESVKMVEPLRGGIVSGQILLDLTNSPAHIISKLDMLKNHPDEFDESWETGIRQLFGEVQSVYVGQQNIAVIPK